VDDGGSERWQANTAPYTITKPVGRQTTPNSTSTGLASCQARTNDLARLSG
jgi:hypothetical protein